MMWRSLQSLSLFVVLCLCLSWASAVHLEPADAVSSDVNGLPPSSLQEPEYVDKKDTKMAAAPSTVHTKASSAPTVMVSKAQETADLPEGTQVTFQGAPSSFPDLHWKQMNDAERKIAVIADLEDRHAKSKVQAAKKDFTDLVDQLGTQSHHQLADMKQKAEMVVNAEAQEVVTMNQLLKQYEQNKVKEEVKAEAEVQKAQQSEQDTKTLMQADHDREQTQKAEEEAREKRLQAQKKALDEMKAKNDDVIAQVKKATLKAHENIQNMKQQSTMLKFQEQESKKDAARTSSDAKSMVSRITKDQAEAAQDAQQLKKELEAENEEQQKEQEADKRRRGAAAKAVKELQQVAQEERKKEREISEKERKDLDAIVESEAKLSDKEKKKVDERAKERLKTMRENYSQKLKIDRDMKKAVEKHQEEMNEAMQNEETVKGSAAKAGLEAEKARQDHIAIEEKAKAAKAADDKEAAARTQEQAKKSQVRMEEAKQKSLELQIQEKKDEQTLKDKMEETKKANAKEQEGRIAKYNAQKETEEAEKNAMRAARAAEGELQSKQLAEQITKNKEKARLEALNAMDGAREAYRLAEVAVQEAKKANFEAENMKKPAQDRQYAVEVSRDADPKKREDLMKASLEAAEQWYRSTGRASNASSIALAKALTAVYKAEDTNNETVIASAKALHKKTKLVDREVDAAYGVAKETFTLRQSDLKTQSERAAEYMVALGDEEMAKKKEEATQKTLMKQRTSIVHELYRSVNISLAKVDSASKKEFELGEAVHEMMQSTDEKDQDVEYFKAVAEGVKMYLESVKGLLEEAKSALADVDRYIEAARLTENSQIWAQARSKRPHVVDILEQSQKLLDPAREEYTLWAGRLAEAKMKAERAARVAEESEKGEKQREENAKKKEAADRKAAQPTRVDTNSGFEPFGTAYRVPQFARAGPLCVLSGMVRTLSEGNNATAFAIVPPSCRPERPVTVKAQQTTLTVQPDGTIDMTGLPNKRKWISLDAISYPIQGTNAGLLPLGEGLKAAAGRVPQWIRDGNVCSFQGGLATVVGGSVIATVPEECQPEGGAVRIGGVIIDPQGPMKTLPGTSGPLSLDGIVYAVKAAPKDNLITLQGKWRADDSEFRTPSFSINGRMCVLHGALANGIPKTVIGTLPEACRPQSGRIVVKDENDRRVDISPTGSILFVNPGTGDDAVREKVSLEGIAFMLATTEDWEVTTRKYYDTQRQKREEKAKIQEQQNKASANEEQAKKLAAEAEPTPVAPAEPFDEYGRGERLPQYSMFGGMCVVSGMIENEGTRAESIGQPILTLPVSCRPVGTESFSLISSKGQVIRVDVQADGKVIYVGGAYERRISLSGITFLASAQKDQGKPIALTSAWEAQEGHSQPYLYTKDGYCLLGGSVRGGEQWDTPITRLPEECQPDKELVFHASNGNTTHRLTIHIDGRVSYDLEVEHSELWVSLSGLFYSVKTGTVLEGLADTIKVADADENPRRPPSFRVTRHLCTLNGGFTAKEAGAVVTLPEECRPSTRVSYAVSSDGATHETAIAIDRNGAVTVSSKGWASLDGIVFSQVHLTKWEAAQADELAEEQAAELLAKQQAEAAARAIRDGAKIPNDIDLNENYAVASVNARAAQSAKFGEICMLSGELTGSGAAIGTVDKSCFPAQEVVVPVRDFVTQKWYTATVNVQGQISLAPSADTSSVQISLSGIRYPSPAAQTDSNNAALTVTSPWIATLNASVIYDAGFCVLSGRVLVEGNTADSPNMAELPTGSPCKPVKNHRFVVSTGEGKVEMIELAKNGKLTFRGSGTNTTSYVALDGISYAVNVTDGVPLPKTLAAASVFFHPPSYTYADQLCVLSGAFVPASGQSQLFQLPNLCRPSTDVTFAVAHGDNAAVVEQITVHAATGAVVWSDGTVAKSEQPVFLDGISFLHVNLTQWEKDARAEARKVFKAVSIVATNERLAANDAVVLDGASQASVKQGLQYVLPQAVPHGGACLLSGTAASTSSALLATVPDQCRPSQATRVIMHSADKLAFEAEIGTDGKVRRLPGSKVDDKQAQKLSFDGVSVLNSNATSVGALTPVGTWSGNAVAYVDTFDSLCTVQGQLKVSSVDEWDKDIALLPPKCRPDAKLVFMAANGARMHQISVDRDGMVRWEAGRKTDITTLSLSQIQFYPKTGNKNINFNTGFSAVGSPYRTVSFTKSAGVCVVSGMVSGATKGNNETVIATLPGICRPIKGDLEFDVIRPPAAVQRVRIGMNGAIRTVQGNAPGMTISLDGIRFTTKGFSEWESSTRSEIQDLLAAKAAEEKVKAKQKEEAEKRKLEEDKKAAEKAEQEKKKMEEEKAKVAHLLPLQENVVAFGKGYALPQFNIYGDVCILDGVAYSEDLDRTISVLPAKCRPKERHAFDIHVAEVQNMRFDAFPNGNFTEIMKKSSTPARGWVSFSGVMFPVSGAEPKPLPLHSYWNNMKGYAPLSYTKQGDLCVLSGMVYHKNGWQGHVTTLPEECRPQDGQLIMHVNRGVYSARFDIYRNGQVRYQTQDGASSNYISFAGVSFFTESASQPLELAYGYSNYGSGYRRPSWRREDKLCVLSGLARGPDGYGHVATVSRECTPNRRMIFTISRHQNRERLDVLPDGKVMWVDGVRNGHGWISLDGVSYTVGQPLVPINEPVPETVSALMTLENNWKPEGNGYRAPEFTRFGHLCALSGIPIARQMQEYIAVLPEACRPSKRLVFATHGQSVHDPTRVDIFPDGRVWPKGGVFRGGWLALDGIIFPVASARLHGIRLQNHLKPYNTHTYEAPSYFVEDGICVLSGMFTRKDRNPLGTGWFFTLPSECRPNSGRVFSTRLSANEYEYKAEIHPDGRVWLNSHKGTRYPWVSIAGIHFAVNGGDMPLQLIYPWWPYPHSTRIPFYYKTAGKWCMLGGGMTNNGGDQLLILPVNCRPKERLSFFTWNAYHYNTRMDVLPDGRVMVTGGWRGHGNVFLDGISFYADEPTHNFTKPSNWLPAVNRNIKYSSGVEAFDAENPLLTAKMGSLCVMYGTAKMYTTFVKPLGEVNKLCIPAYKTVIGMYDWNNRNFVHRMDLDTEGLIKGVNEPGVATQSGNNPNYISPGTFVYPASDAEVNDMQLWNRWVNYGKGYTPARYIRQGGICTLDGFIRTDNWNTNTYHPLVTMLPPECTPDDGTIMVNVPHGKNVFQVLIQQDGKLFIHRGSVADTPYFSLSGISFPVPSSPRRLLMQNGWWPTGSGYRVPSYTIEGNLCYVSGVVNNNNNNRVMTTLPDGCRPAVDTTYYTSADTRVYAVLVKTNGEMHWLNPRFTTQVGLDGITIVTRDFAASQSETQDDIPDSEEGKALQLMNGAKKYGRGFRTPIFTRVGPLCVLSGRFEANDVRIQFTTLPKNCRPAQRQVFFTANGYRSNEIAARIDVFPDGTIEWVSGPRLRVWGASIWDGGYVNLDGISFAVAKKDIHPLRFANYLANVGLGYQTIGLSKYKNLCVLSGYFRHRFFSNIMGGGWINIDEEGCKPDANLRFLLSHGNEGQSCQIERSGRLTHVALNSYTPYVSLSGVLYAPKTGARLEMNSGWGTYGYGRRAPSVTRVDNLCVLGGAAGGSRPGAIAYLPGRCRPKERLSFNTENHMIMTRIDITKDGRVILPYSNGYSYVSLDGIYFVVPEDAKDDDVKLSVIPEATNTTDTPLTLIAPYKSWKRGYAVPTVHRLGDLCMLSGVARGDISKYQKLAVVSEDCRPGKDLTFSAYSDNAFPVHLHMDTNGTITYDRGSTEGSFWSFSPILYPRANVTGSSVRYYHSWVDNENHKQQPLRIVKQGDLCVLYGSIRTQQELMSEFTLWLFHIPTACVPDRNMALFFNINDARRTMGPTLAYQERNLIRLHSGAGNFISPHFSFSGIAWTVHAKGENEFKFRSGWSNYNHGWRQLSYQLQSGVCFVSGLARTNGASDALVLPEACRPLKRHSFFLNHAHANAWRMDVHPDGNVEFITGYRRTDYVAMDGMRFVAAPVSKDE